MNSKIKINQNQKRRFKKEGKGSVRADVSSGRERVSCVASVSSERERVASVAGVSAFQAGGKR